MLVILPFLALLLLVLVCRTGEPLWRQAILSAAVVWGVLVTMITEVLSLFHALTTGWVATLWTIVSLGLALGYGLIFRQQKALPALTLPRPPLSSVVMLAGIGLIVATTALIALVAPPNTWDSMTYHMSRIANWIQNQTVAHYPTHMTTQLQRSPWAEFAVMHLQLLSHGDRFANLIQWLSMIGSVLGTSLIAKQLGADARGQLFASVVTSTIPIGILEASSTQTDYAATFWMVCFASFMLRLTQEGTDRGHQPAPWLAGASLGLGVLTKSTVYLYAPPFLVWGAAVLWTKHRWQSWRPLLVLLAIALLVNAGHYQRNLDLFGSPLGFVEEACAGCRYPIEGVSPAIFLSNVVRNVGVHLGTPSVTINEAVLRGIEALHRFLEIDVNDPRSTSGGSRFGIILPTGDENLDGNLLHLLLMACVLPLVFFHHRLREPPCLRSFVLCLIAAFLLFCLYLKWWANHSRLHLPLFVLWSPVIGIALSRLRSPRGALAVVACVLITSLPWVFLNAYRPVIGERTIFNTDRFTQYFFRSPRMADTFREAAKFVNNHGCTQVGLVRRDLDDWEYPLWVLFNANLVPVRIQHVSVTNASATLAQKEPFHSFSPCALITLEGPVVTVSVNVSPTNPGMIP